MRIACLTLCLAAITVSGCARLERRSSNIPQYETVSESSSRNEKLARRKHELALELICENNYCKAEQVLRDALICDVSFGPAHNTLGKIYFDQGKHYLAAWEFEYAQRMMPERPEPVNNLGLVYESIGQYQKAIPYYQLAVDFSPDCANYLGNLIRCRIRSGEDPLMMEEEINHLALIDDRQHWVNWARSQLLLRNNIDTDLYPPPPDVLPYEPQSVEDFNELEPIDPVELEGNDSILQPLDLNDSQYEY